MEIFAFGSLCRGEIDQSSDIDLLLIKNKDEKLNNLDIDKFSIYNRNRIEEIWNEGNPFSWHLFLESKQIFSTSGENIFKDLGKPKPYQNLENDLKKFSTLYYTSRDFLMNSSDSRDFELSMIFLAIRNFATCYSLGKLKQFNFSRKSAHHLGEDSIPVSKTTFKLLERSRILSTRGFGNLITDEELKEVFSELVIIDNWFDNLVKKSKI
ncbi:nucleotidyltransferase domain-containing protein [Christiangramia fulva]|uniref:Nucleotidyltransferase domain-containing protein n=1 Tax=Christiangramia fulva TaxID=2126553 RepID=A0A2R3Z593_9FLAO|nr:nucleotidyltransferase domain-containing protein [Christiangramia fulva]AVR45429.1 nucleotidyltransferase domain-containing protein [Christiangramia fulva]